MEFLSQTEIPKIGTSITFDFIIIISMVLMIILSTTIVTVFVSFELNWIVEYSSHLCIKITRRHVPIAKIKIMTCFIIENILVVDEMECIIYHQENTRQISRLKTLITIEQLSCNINCNTTSKD